MCDGIDWATFHNKPTFIELCWVWIINSLSQSGSLQHESDGMGDRYGSLLIWGKIWEWLTKFKALAILENWERERDKLLVAQRCDRFLLSLDDHFILFWSVNTNFHALRRRYSWNNILHFLTKYYEGG
jgi:hypothetical protein